MADVILRQEAINDLKDIWDYTFKKWSENQADKYYATLKIACKEIGDNHEFAKKYDKISKNLFGLKSGKHIIFFQHITEGEIEIIRILHERMDLKSRIYDKK